MGFTPPAEHFTSQRLDLEPLSVTHVTEMVDVLSDQKLYTFDGGEPPTPERLLHRYTMLVAGSGDDNEQWHNWILRLSETREPIGYVQATVENTQTEIAWMIGTPWQGNGYAKEAAGAMAQWLLGNNAPPLVAWIHPDHVASNAVARSLGLAQTSEVDEDGEHRWQ